ncbi:MAG TPA: c-type cytochrome biogenesis protein CcmI, partial [Azonexus sp.]|nr:c-type cytochrome biogenesis protein CcmI [Azonexus sp.]
GGPPLAVQRFKAADLPVQFKLDDSSAVMPGRTISQVAEVVLSAKVSRSGQAEAQAGDIYGAPLKVKVGAGNLKLELDQER